MTDRMASRRTAGLVLLAVASCTDPAPTSHALRFTAPRGIGELVPSDGATPRTLAIAWETDHPDASPIELVAVPITPAGPSRVIGRAVAGDRSASWSSADAGRPGVYRLLATVGDTTYPHPAGVLVQGIELPDPSVTFRGSDPGRELRLVATTGTSIALTLAVVPAAGGEEIPFAEKAVESDLAPILYTVTFDGRALDGRAIPAGDYDLVIEVDALGGTVHYTVRGTRIAWRPDA